MPRYSMKCLFAVVSIVAIAIAPALKAGSLAAGG